MNKERAREIIKDSISNKSSFLLNLSSSSEVEKLTSIDLAELMPDILKLKNLENINLSGNQISDISVISKLKSLRSLDLNNNAIRDITAISELKKLEYLHLAFNQISDISAVSELKNLVILSIPSNQISDISALSNLKNIETLGLSTNKISDITPISKLKKLHTLYIQNNKNLAENIPTEILLDSTNPQKIINYFLNITEGITRPLNEAKIVVIGEADVGKTCLINKLVYNKIEETDSTHGIQIHHWEGVKRNNEDLKLNVWDFGGQEIMHSTHQFFFTKRTIYILVIDARKNEDLEKTEEWLKRIESFGGDSPIIIIGNQIDQNKRNPNQKGIGFFDINRRGLQDKYKNIKAFYGLCAYDKKVKVKEELEEYAGLFEKFKKELIEEISNLEGIDTPFPSDWFNVKEDLEAMHENDIPYISKNQYITNCIERKVKDETSQTTIVEFLNEVGTIIYFEDLPDTMVFNPEWITNAVYAIVDNSFIKEKKGIFKREYLKTLLDTKTYPADKHDYILNMMKKFQLCVDVEPNQTFLLPDLLSTSQPDEIKEDDWKNTLGFQYHYETYLPNIFTRFIVKVYQHRHNDLYWRNGIVLEQEQSKALVKADVVGKKIEISVKGSNWRNNQSLLTYIRTELREIHTKFALLSIKKKVPHPNYPEIEPKDYDELIIMEEAGEEEVFVKELRRKLSINEWLDGVESLAERRRKKANEEEHLVSYQPISKLPVKVEENSMILQEKKENLAKLKKRLEILEAKKNICDIESEKDGNKIAKTFFVLTTLIHIISFGVLIYLIFSYQDGWNNFEKWTFGIFVGLELLNLLISTGFFLKTSREFSWTEFRNALAERKREKKYLVHGIDSSEIEELKREIEKAEK